MKLTRLMLVGSLFLIQQVAAKDFLARINNPRMMKNPPASISDFNMIFDVELCSETKDGIFANISSIGGCHVHKAGFLYNDGKTYEKFGGHGLSPLSYDETEVFVYVAGDKPQAYTYKKVATICTDLESEVTAFKALPDVSGVKNFKGVIKMILKVFSIHDNKFSSYRLEVGFVANRLPTGNMMDFSMGAVSITEPVSEQRK